MTAFDCSTGPITPRQSAALNRMLDQFHKVDELFTLLLATATQRTPAVAVREAYRVLDTGTSPLGASPLTLCRPQLDRFREKVAAASRDGSAPPTVVFAVLNAGLAVVSADTYPHAAEVLARPWRDTVEAHRRITEAGRVMTDTASRLLPDWRLSLDALMDACEDIVSPAAQGLAPVVE